ncbi:hypothetical protein HMI56_004758 [Coelomomyces lativittatus]|nr:hypothetical protein HMI56_004758 [Coelomomyces lativittatus]
MKLTGLVLFLLLSILFLDAQSNSGSSSPKNLFKMDDYASPKIGKFVQCTGKRKKYKYTTHGGEEKARKKTNKLLRASISNCEILSFRHPQTNFDAHLGSQTSVSDRTQVNVMTSDLLELWRSDFNMFSPIGLYKILDTLSIMTSKESLSIAEVNKKKQFKGLSSTQSWTYTWNVHWVKKNHFVFANAFMWPTPALPIIPKPELMAFLKENNIALVNSQTSLNNFAKEVTGGLITHVPIPQGPTSLAFVNIVMFRLAWLRAPSLSSSLHVYQYGKKGKLKKIEIHYMKHRLQTKFHTTPLYQACILPLAHNVKEPAASLEAYIFSFHSTRNPEKVGEMWKRIHKDLSERQSSFIDIFLPNAELEETIDFSQEMSPRFFEKNNPFFTTTGVKKDVTLLLRQMNKFCMDKFGVPTTLFSKGSFSRSMTFNKPFYVVLTNPETGVPVFITKVTRGLDSKLHFCT